MRRVAFVTLAFTFLSVVGLWAEDPATEERFNKLAGQIDDLRSNQEAITRRLESLAKEIDALRAKADKPVGTFASDDDVKRLADAVKEIDRKRLEDYERIHNELKSLGRSLSAPAPAAPRKTRAPIEESTATEKTGGADKGFEYQVKTGDTLSIIVHAYRDKNIKVTMDQILKANPGLKPERLRVGQTIFIPAPPS